MKTCIMALAILTERQIINKIFKSFFNQKILIENKMTHHFFLKKKKKKIGIN